MQLDPSFKKVLEDYDKRVNDENQLMESLSKVDAMKRRDEFLLPVGEDAAIFMNTLIKSAKSKSILEIGTSYGYSTLWLAEAARTNGGKVITLENNLDKIMYAKDKISKAGLSKFVDFRHGDALLNIKNATETFDFVLLDLWKELYVPCFNLFSPKLNDGAWVLGDNMIFPPISKKESEAYQNIIRAKETFTSILLPIGSGIEVSQYHS
ncbi:class I SAM-dependent methyltransferase [Winogradskyella echinorum]|uniref:Class I SAM-dependent methyltransferase n=1 Tax=Winogradskyella echinorum TaxID=538189 RepID=A0ABR6Y0T3_9FLAO|nr:class I SAM-dependent methyltransferase [Winogradskyella echinorum]MBC3846315.1 class I SAM-dependent methyltransferase [Winogradskyella echinorum]MBC5750663.1 class I SAM-dependent methyltransferase [Winogradskyella echinorum]